MSTFLRIISAILLFSFSELFAQDSNQPSPKFPLGAFLNGDNVSEGVLESFDTSGLAIAAWRADNSTSSFLDNYKVFANNAGWTDWIQYYATCYYSRWEGEQDTTIEHIGVKHKYGKDTTWQGIRCWSSSGLTAPACSLMYGPHYRQDQRHKSYYHTGDTWGVNYIPRFNLALSNPFSLNASRPICVLKVVYRYAKVYSSGNWELEDTVFLRDTLRISDFPTNDNFEIFNIVQNGINYYSYPEKFRSAITSDRITMSAAFPDTVSTPDTLLKYEDRNSDNGIQFCVDYLGDDSTKLFIDYVEVYDQDGWDEYINPQTHGNVLTKLQTYVQNYSEWDNIIYWYGQDEPYSQDSFTPIHIVDSLVQDMGGAPVTQYFQPDWRILVNGDSFMVDYYRKAKPPELIIDPYPFSPAWYPVRWEDLESLRQEFQIAHSLKPGFWFIGQSFGETLNGEPHIWRLPDSTELKASVMLALAHGLKGLLFWNYNSYQSSDGVYVMGMVDENGSPSHIWYFLHNNLVPRLQGTLGNTLMNLDYTGYCAMIIQEPIPPEDSYPSSVDYLALSSDEPFYRFLAGLLKQKGTSDNKYFLLTNLRTDYNLPVTFTVSNNFGVNNLRIKNVENPSALDTTVNNQLVKEVPISPGEGFLFQVAPVVKYGGKFYYSDTLNINTALYDNMTIENGATLTVNAIYDCYANIYVRGSGKIVTTNGGTINFHNGNGIIVEDSPQIYGTSSYKLTLDFGSETEGTGIQVLQGADFKLEYCILKNADNLISCNLSQHQTSISHCDFQNTSSYAISLSGSSIHVPSINYCTFTNTDYGIFSAGQSSITISYNTFTDNKTAISLSQIPSAQILINSITSDLKEGPGILLSSCSAGTARGNIISGHTNGISLGNSSPLIGANTIEDNKINGIYAGPGSTPDLRGSLAGHPPNQYPISGYNIIWNNGGYTTIGSGEINDDGSEIFLNGSGSILLDYGCNYIADDRTVSPPLLTKLYLINGSSGRRYNARSNAWGDTVYAGRFGRLTLVYNPHNDTVCPLPSLQGLLVIQDNDGNAIDTVYSAGEPNYTVSPLDLSYSEAAEDMINRDYSSADNIFNSIITSSPGDSSSQNAYLGLYKSKRLQNADSTTLAELRELYNNNLPQISDSVMMKVVSQLSLLTLVDEKQYNEAMLGFYDIINQNPETDEALFAEIDAMTTSLLAQNGNDTTLGKSLYKGLLVKGPKDMQMRMNELIKSRFGTEENKSAKGIIPTKYSLYNNYPNPFNPTTTIRFDLPEITNVELAIYNILGQKVKTLIANETRIPGRYEVNFNGNSLASGVYIYRLTTQNFSQSKKMLLIK